MEAGEQLEEVVGEHKACQAAEGSMCSALETVAVAGN